MPVRERALPAAGFGLFGVGLALALIVSRELLYSLQGGVSELAGLLPFGYAYAAGMVAAVNPCGIVFVPSLVAYYLGDRELPLLPWWERAVRALAFGAIATVGFVVLFGTIGLVIGAGGRALGAYFPAGGLAVGVLLAAMGLGMLLADRGPALARASQAMGLLDLAHRGRSLFLFGLAYGVASLACTLPIFLVVVGTSLALGGLLPALGQFLSYALGMGTLVTAAVLAAGFFQGSLSRLVGAVAPHVHRVAASFLLGAGLFIVYYWLGPGGLWPG